VQDSDPFLDALIDALDLTSPVDDSELLIRKGPATDIEPSIFKQDPALIASPDLICPEMTASPPDATMPVTDKAFITRQELPMDIEDWNRASSTASHVLLNHTDPFTDMKPLRAVCVDLVDKSPTIRVIEETDNEDPTAQLLVVEMGPDIRMGAPIDASPETTDDPPTEISELNPDLLDTLTEP
jgi:hypothetical protein